MIIDNDKVMVTEVWTKEKGGKIKCEMFFNGYTPHNYFKMQRGETDGNRVARPSGHRNIQDHQA